MLSQMFHSEMMRMPLPTPETAESVATIEMITIRMTCVITPGSIPNRWLRPVAIWLTPRPSEVATPNTVPNTASRSTAWPAGP